MKKLKKLYRIQLVLLCLVGIGALFGGFLGIDEVSSAVKRRCRYCAYVLDYYTVLYAAGC
ncbi:hypothetical protein MASR2M70_19850 [Bacillota bacterium]